MTAPKQTACHWCAHPVPSPLPTVCPRCGMDPSNPHKVDRTVGGKVDPAKARSSARNRRTTERQKPLSREPQNRPVLGIDPGARFTGLVVRDGDVVLYSETVVRFPTGKPDPFTDPEWALHCVERAEKVVAMWKGVILPIGIEGVAQPKGFKHGKRAALNPKHIIQAAMVVGAMFQRWKDAVEIPPGGNGSQHITHYPPEIVGARPKDLPGTSAGAGTRGHEQSAYDVAGKAAAVVYKPMARAPIPGLRS